MKCSNLSKKITYSIGLGGAIVSGYVAAYFTSKHLGINDYTPAVITLATLASKEAAFFGGNILAHSTARCLAYSGIQDWFEDVKNLSVSNAVSCIGFGLIAKSSLHYILMHCGMDSDKAMLSAYVPAGIMGISIKLYLDSKKDLLTEKTNLTMQTEKLEQIVNNSVSPQN